MTAKDLDSGVFGQITYSLTEPDHTWSLAPELSNSPTLTATIVDQSPPDLTSNHSLSYGMSTTGNTAIAFNSNATHPLPLAEAARLFSIDSQTGRLGLRFSPDREAMPEYWLAVEAKDGGEQTGVSEHVLGDASSSLTSKTRVRVLVRDTNDMKPLFQRPSYEFVLEQIPVGSAPS
ncbi:unnamed protein product [Protopolystoma xenopodis]|uniref:Cadherin domain-containing protein n=1 Tax=Protopolystoma xenopodis TaxID=117903 RepID=A0A3S5CVC5_9PLAT|nr:unnamed protein product [Protopolystoma xenopodis]